MYTCQKKTIGKNSNALISELCIMHQPIYPVYSLSRHSIFKGNISSPQSSNLARTIEEYLIVHYVVDRENTHPHSLRKTVHRKIYFTFNIVSRKQSTFLDVLRYSTGHVGAML